MMQNEPRRDLSELVLNAVAVPGESYDRIAGRSIDPLSDGQRAFSGSWLHNLAKGDIARAPDVSFLRALAVGLSLPFAVVQRAAAAQFLLYEATELSGYGDDVRIIVAHLAGMPEDEVRRVRRMVEVYDQQS